MFFGACSFGCTHFLFLKEKTMFDNIGGKIKVLVSVICIIGIIVSVIIGITTISEGDEFIVAGVIIMVVGSLAAWLSSFVLYGFGELIEKTCEIAKIMRAQVPNEIFKDDNEEEELPQKTCPRCGSEHDFDYPKCPICKYQYNDFT